MQLIGITTEQYLQNEASQIHLLLENGIDILHVRKPFFSEKELSVLLSEIREDFYERIVLHDYFDLTSRFPVRGIHLNKRNHCIPLHYEGKISRSCHNIDEIRNESEPYEYQFLSPVFDSISKNGYSSGFSNEQLTEASRKNIIHSKIIALGGITPERILQLKPYSFGGVAVLGYLWESSDSFEIKQRIKNLQSALSQIEE